MPIQIEILIVTLLQSYNVTSRECTAEPTLLCTFSDFAQLK